MFSPEQHSQPNRHETTAKANFRSFRFNKLIFRRARVEKQETIRVWPQILTSRRIGKFKAADLWKVLIGCQDFSQIFRLFSARVYVNHQFFEGKFFSGKRQTQFIIEGTEGTASFRRAMMARFCGRRRQLHRPWMSKYKMRFLGELWPERETTKERFSSSSRQRISFLVMTSWIHSGSECDGWRDEGKCFQVFESCGRARAPGKSEKQREMERCGFVFTRS